MLNNIEMITLMQTLVAAQQGSFQKAGLLLSVPASTVSRRVRRLEALIGAKLFERHRHGIRPTAASDTFLKPLRRILDELNMVLINASTAARGKAGRLKIGSYVSPSSGHLRAVLSEYRQGFPNVDIQYIDGERYDLIERLNAGSIDIAIVADHFRSGVHDVTPLWQEKVLVAMPASHRLARKTSVAWDDLRKEQIFIGRDPGPELRDHLIAKLKLSGDVPAIQQFDVGRDYSLSLVGIERDITLLYEEDAGVRHRGVVYRPVSDQHKPSLVPYYACWLPGNDNPALQRFLDLIRAHKEPHCSHHGAPAG